MNTSQESLRDIYKDWWLDAMAYYQGGKVNADPHLMDLSKDRRKGITLIVRPDGLVAEQVWMVINKLKSIEPDQHYYQKKELHMTVLSLFSATEAYEPYFAKLEEYQSAVDAALSEKRKFTLRFEGITASKDCVMVQGFPQDSEIEEIRGDLRTELNKRGLAEGLEVRYRIQTAHLTFVRYKSQLSSMPDFLDALIDFRKTNFGSMQVEYLDLVINNWYMTADRVELIERYSIN